MTEKEITALAFKFEPLPADASYTDKMLWNYLCALYRMSASNILTADRGRELKTEFVSCWEYVNTKLDTLTKIAEHDADKWLRLENIKKKWVECRKKYDEDKFNAMSAEDLINAAEEFRKEVYIG